MKEDKTIVAQITRVGSNDKVNEFEEMLIDKATDFTGYDYKKYALEEIEDLEKKNIFVPNISFIVDQYPDFNHIAVKLEIPKSCILKICIDPNIILENKEATHAMAVILDTWREMGAKFEETK